MPCKKKKRKRSANRRIGGRHEDAPVDLTQPFLRLVGLLKVQTSTEDVFEHSFLTRRLKMRLNEQHAEEIVQALPSPQDGLLRQRNSRFCATQRRCEKNSDANKRALQLKKEPALEEVKGQVQKGVLGTGHVKTFEEPKMKELLCVKQGARMVTAHREQTYHHHDERVERHPTRGALLVRSVGVRRVHLRVERGLQRGAMMTKSRVCEDHFSMQTSRQIGTGGARGAREDRAESLSMTKKGIRQTCRR